MHDDPYERLLLRQSPRFPPVLKMEQLRSHGMNANVLPRLLKEHALEGRHRLDVAKLPGSVRSQAHPIERRAKTTEFIFALQT